MRITNEDMKYLLLERKCLKSPAFLSFSMDEYAKIIYEVINASWAKDRVPFIVCCYSRQFLPNCLEDTCIVSDVHYLEFLGDLSHFYRENDHNIIEALFCKYMKNNYLASENMTEATFYEWLIREKQYRLSPFSKDDYQNAFIVNLVAIMHETAHFFNDLDALFESLFKEHDIDKQVQNVAETIREGKCDFLGLTLLLKKGSNLHLSQEQMVEAYIQMMIANSFYKSFERMELGDYDIVSFAKAHLDRVKSTLQFLQGMSPLFPELNMKRVNLDLLKVFSDGIHHIWELISSKFIEYDEEFNALEDSYKESIANELNEEEKTLKNNKEIVIYPEIPFITENEQL